ncbi:MAG: TetR/AcrR family transcriptional regulator [Candidatus Onthomonas sp.]
MKREEKNALSRQRILNASLEEFSQKGYEGASLSTVCAEKGISKGIVYHYFRDKDEIYLLCVRTCFDQAADWLQGEMEQCFGPPEERLRHYFDARLRFFAAHPDCQGIFAGAVLNPPAHLTRQISDCRSRFDTLNIAVLTALLQDRSLRPGLSVSAIVEDFRLYMDFFHSRFRMDCNEGESVEQILREYEERCRRQLDVLLYGVLGD